MSWWLSFKRKVFRILANGVVRLIARVEIEGWDRLKNTKGNMVVVCNHLGRLDAFLTVALVPRDDYIVVIAEKYRKSAVVRWIARSLDMLFLERFEADLGTLKEVLRRLSRGGVLVIAPEGTRSATEALQEGKPGAAFLAAKTDSMILPVAVTGTEDQAVSRQFRSWRRPHIRIKVGEAFSLPPLPKTQRDEYLQEQTKKIMVEIAKLLPVPYRGVYTGYVKD